MVFPPDGGWVRHVDRTVVVKLGRVRPKCRCLRSWKPPGVLGVLDLVSVPMATHPNEQKSASSESQTPYVRLYNHMSFFEGPWCTVLVD